MIKLGVSGAHGKMGQTITDCIQANEGVDLGTSFDRDDNLSQIVDSFDVLIDFTRPEATIDYLEICRKSNKPIVIGTTGFDNSGLQKIQNAAKDIPIVFAPNMSVGVNLTLKLLEQTAKVIGEDADIEIVEAHHRYKVDSPSGTALKLGEVIANTLGRDLSKCAIYGRQGIEEPRNKNTIAFSTIRGGDVVGEHTVYFFLDGERIEITHKASSRSTFANGAIRAARWLGEKSSGLYSMQDVLDL